ncbi:hypothetical protein [Thermomonas carbonis]|uniref:Uncharacterized protein n=1 Tax=Thermomonas carbonis TaxID=1463158 RepID=A0A7G9SNL0_9GAMM|nr:hypothetical protein [Thermomonas carbonis]QNN69435.1 hypothetical protein H9L16_12220 [Thermomonas carbonis]GHC12877.1 hypothetical protein GCM10010080_30520 [Thermomonas carbonis]
MTQSPTKDRLDVWFDGSAICIVAVASNGDPLDMSESEAEEFLAKLQLCIAQAKAA